MSKLTKADIARKADELHALKQQLTTLSDEVDAIEDTIKRWMGDRETATAGAWHIKWTRYTTDRLDSKALKADHPDIATAYTKSSECRRFDIL